MVQSIHRLWHLLLMIIESLYNRYIWKRLGAKVNNYFPVSYFLIRRYLLIVMNYLKSLLVHIYIWTTGLHEKSHILYYEIVQSVVCRHSRRLLLYMLYLTLLFIFYTLQTLVWVWTYITTSEYRVVERKHIKGRQWVYNYFEQM